MSGLGSSPFGSSPYGSGTPAVAPETGGSVFAVDGGGNSGSRFVDYRTRDYVFDTYGRMVGMSDVAQLVQLAVAGIKFSGGRIAAATQGELQRKVDAALKPLVDGGLITVEPVELRRFGTSGGAVAVKWTDLETLEESTVPLG